MVGWLNFNIIEKIPFMVYLEIQCITFKMEKSFIAHPWIQRSVVGLEEYSAHDWRAATSGTARSSYLARVGPVEAAILNSGVARQKLGLWNSLCTTEPTLLEVIKWLSKVHYAHIQLDDEVTSNIVYWAMKSRTGSVDACNPQFQLQ